MFRLIVTLLFIVVVFCSANVFAAEYCSEQKINQKITGTWKGSDLYALRMHINSQNNLCITIIDETSNTERNIRDIIIVNGKLRHLSYYTPSTDGYVIYANIEFTGEEMKFYWYSSYKNQSGEDSYFLQKK